LLFCEFDFYNGLEQITVTENEVEDILKILDTSKAIGPDLLNLRLLKEAASYDVIPYATLGQMLYLYRKRQLSLPSLRPTLYQILL
jgi:hypothetical protein